MTPPKIDKSHGFMQSIIKNQVLRDEYDKEQRQLANAKKSDDESSSQNNRLEPVEEKTKRNRTPRRAPKVELYVPPHLKKRGGQEQTDPKTKESPEVTESPEVKQELRRLRKSQKDQESRVLFKFEYEDDEGKVKSLLVKEDDNAEDLAETFGNQLGLTKPLRKALQRKLQMEITSCHDS